MAKKKSTETAGSNVSEGFKSKWFAVTLEFVKDEKKLSLQYPEITHAQAEYICSLIRPNIVKNWVSSKPEYTALYEALIIFGLKFEFKLSLVGENSKSLLLTKVPKNEKKTEEQTMESQTKTVMDAIKSPKVIDKITHSFMLETTQMILDFIEDKTRATLEITNVKPLESLFLQCAMTAASPLFPEHSKLLSYVKIMAPNQNFYLKVDVLKLNCKGKSALRNVTFTKVPKFDSAPKNKTNSRKWRKKSSKTDKWSEMVESSVCNITKKLDNALNLGNKCSNTSSDKLDSKSVNSISFISAQTKSVSNKTLLKTDPAQISMSKISCLSVNSVSSALSKEKSSPQTSSVAVDRNIYPVSQKCNCTRNLTSNTNSVPSNSKLLLRDCIVPKSSQCDISVVSRVLDSPRSTFSQKDPVGDSSTSEKFKSNNDSENVKTVRKNVFSSGNIGSVSINLTESQINAAKINLRELKPQNRNCLSFREKFESRAGNVDYFCVNTASSLKTSLKSNSSTKNSNSPCNSCLGQENVESYSSSSKSVCVCTPISSKTDLKSRNSSLMENTKSNSSSILEKFLNSMSTTSRNLGSSKTSSSVSDLASIFNNVKLIPERTTEKAILSRSVPDLRMKLQNIQSARSESTLNEKLAYEDIFGNINKPFFFEFPYSVDSPNSVSGSRNSVLGSRNSVLESTSSGMESNLERTVSTPTLTSQNICINSKNTTTFHNTSVKMKNSQNLGASTSELNNSTPKRVAACSNVNNLGSLKSKFGSTLRSDNSSQSLVTKESCRSNLESSISEVFTGCSSRSGSILDLTGEMSAGLNRRKTTKIAKVRTKGQPSLKNTRKMDLMEALSVPLHIEKSARIMKIMGYQGGPLGLRGEGITEPIMPSLDLVNRAGLGYPKVDPKNNTGKPNQGTTNNNVNNVMAPVMRLNPLNIDPPVIQECKNSKGQPLTRKCKFRIALIKAAIELITTNVATATVAYNGVPRKQRGFVKFFLQTVNERRNISFGISEDKQLFEQLKVMMKTSPWYIEGCETDNMKFVTLSKVSSKDTPFKKVWLKSAKTGEVPRHSISSKGFEILPDALDNNNIRTVNITDKRLIDYANNVSIPNIDGYPQICTTKLAFRLIILAEILEFSISDGTSMIIDIAVSIDKDERKFINKLIRPNPCFMTQLEKDTYQDISFMTYKQNSFLHMEFTDQMKLIVYKLLDNPGNRRLSKQRHGKVFLKNINSDHGDDTSVTNNNNVIAKVNTQSNDNMPNIYIINQNDNIQIQITKNAIENITYKISNQPDKKEDNIININEVNDKSAITIKKDDRCNNDVKPIVIGIKNNSDIHFFNEGDNIINVNESIDAVKTEQNEGYACDKPIVIDINENNNIKIMDDNDKENELLRSEDDDVILVDQIDDIILLSDEEADESETLSTVNKKIESVAVTTEVNVNGQLITNNEKVGTSGNSEILSEIADNVGSKIKNSNSSYSDLEFEKDLNELELLSVVDDIDDNNKTEVLIEREPVGLNEPKTRKRSRTDSDLSAHDSKKYKTNGDDFKTVTIIPVNQEDNLTQESVLKIQTLISDTIDNSNELPLLKCLGIKDGGLVYSCHDEKSYLFMVKCLNTEDFKMLNSVTIEDKCHKLKIRLNIWMDDVSRIFNKLGQYNVGLNTEKWRVTDVQKNSDHIIIIVEVDTDSFKYISDNSFSLYAGVDVARFSVHWD